MVARYVKNPRSSAAIRVPSALKEVRLSKYPLWHLRSSAKSASDFVSLLYPVYPDNLRSSACDSIGARPFEDGAAVAAVAPVQETANLAECRP